MNDGISDPIKCYEYLGHFYVVEGNKRVSVLKSMGGVSIWANVTRLLPEAEDNVTVQLYQEFLEFYRCARFYGALCKTGASDMWAAIPFWVCPPASTPLLWGWP